MSSHKLGWGFGGSTRHGIVEPHARCLHASAGRRGHGGMSGQAARRHHGRRQCSCSFVVFVVVFPAGLSMCHGCGLVFLLERLLTSSKSFMDYSSDEAEGTCRRKQWEGFANREVECPYDEERRWESQAPRDDEQDGYEFHGYDRNYSVADEMRQPKNCESSLASALFQPEERHMKNSVPYGCVT
jgi:hypothetical protein